MVNKICVICGEQFEATRSDALYCSRKCAKVNFKRVHGTSRPTRTHYWVECDWCGTAFRSDDRKKKYCCPEHQELAEKKKTRVVEKSSRKSIEEIVAKATEMGMTYGEYVGKYQI